MTLWKKSSATRESGIVQTVDFVSRKKLKCGPQRKYNPSEVVEDFKDHPFSERTTQMHVVGVLGVDMIITRIAIGMESWVVGLLEMRMFNSAGPIFARASLQFGRIVP